MKVKLFSFTKRENIKEQFHYATFANNETALFLQLKRLIYFRNHYRYCFF